MNIPCSICRGEHPRHLSVKVESTGLAAGLECLTQGLRSLLGLPSPEEAEALPEETPPSLEGRNPKPSEYFLLSMAGDDTGHVGPKHFRQALNVIGLYEILKAGPGMNPKGTVIAAGDAETEFFTSPYVSPTGHLQIWMEAHAPGDQSEPPLAAARLSWSVSNTTGGEEFHERAKRLLRSTTGCQDPE